MITRLLLPVLLLFFCTFMNPAVVHAGTDILGHAGDCTAGSDSENSAVCQDDNPGQDNPVIHTLNKITFIVALAAGAGAVLMLLIGSIKYITSDGDSNKVESAKNTIIYSLVGIVVVALAASIVGFVVNKL
jgi:hypothetical protein